MRTSYDPGNRHGHTVNRELYAAGRAVLETGGSST